MGATDVGNHERHEIEIRRKAGQSHAEIARAAAVSTRTIKRVAKEAEVTNDTTPSGAARSLMITATGDDFARLSILRPVRERTAETRSSRRSSPAARRAVAEPAPVKRKDL